MRKHRYAIAIFTCLALTAAACGSDDDSSADSTSAPVATEAGVTTTVGSASTVGDTEPSADTDAPAATDAPATTGAPPGAGVVARPANRSIPRAEKRRPTSSWSAPSTLTASRGDRRSAGHVPEVRARQNDTIGGSSDTEVKELSATPTGAPGPPSRRR